MNEALTALVALVIVWFAVGSMWNVRKGNATMRWMQGGLPLLGERTTVRWLGTTSVEMVIGEGEATLRKGDAGDLPRAPGRALDVGNLPAGGAGATPSSSAPSFAAAAWTTSRRWTARAGRVATRWGAWRPSGGRCATAEPPGQLSVFYKSESAVALGDTLLGLARAAGMTVRAFPSVAASLTCSCMSTCPPVSAPAAEFFRTFRDLGERAARS